MKTVGSKTLHDWLEANNEERKRIEFENLLKHGHHLGRSSGTTTLAPGQTIKVVNGRIIVR